VPRVLFTWLGDRDLKAARGDPGVVGPIAVTIGQRPFDEVHVLSDKSSRETARVQEALAARTHALVETHLCPLSRPTEHREIYEAVVATCERVLARRRNVDLTFHLSPGTPAMHAVWLLVAKTRFPAALIESSAERGVLDVTVPFDISAELVPLTGARLADLTIGAPPELAAFSDIIHRSAVMARVLDQAARASRWDVPILIEGESGTGKELLARAIHAASRRPGKFVAVNCGAIPRELVESTLFGHEKGAFSGATEQRRGVFEAAQRGTVFLDELGELPLDAQVKLLRVVQEGEVTRIGRVDPVEVEVRLVAATHRSLIDEIAAGRFREDLFYRLAVAVLRLPSLRERQGDLPLLIDHFLAHVNQTVVRHGDVAKKLSPSARNALLAHPWPGNVRELENTLSRAAIWSAGPTITADEVRGALLGRAASPDRAPVLGRPLGDGFKLEALLTEVARHYLERAMVETNGNKTKAATLVGLASYQTLTNWLRIYQVKA
jgi:DNA-binding NtrC family response regulator